MSDNAPVPGNNSPFGYFMDKSLNFALYPLGLILGVSQLYYLSFGVRSAMSGRVVFWTLMTVIVLIMYPMDRKKWGVPGMLWDLACLLGHRGPVFTFSVIGCGLRNQPDKPLR